jgi:aspartate aminotransferase
MRLSRRVTSLRPSSTVAVAAKAKELKAAGTDVLSFAAGEPDFDTPEPIKAAAKRALDAGETGYAPPPGDLKTREAIAAKLRSENGIEGVGAEHVVISAGGKQCLYLIFQALLDPPEGGEATPEVILPTPAWVSYRPQVELAGGRVVEVSAGPEQHFKITPGQLREAITSNSRVFVFNSPSNPCGVMYTPEEVRALAGVIEEARETAPDLMVVTDEIYEKLIYGGREHLSMGSIAGVADRVVTVNGFSKAFAMTGWRLGYLAAPGKDGARLAKACAKMQGQINTCVASFTLPAARAALAECAGDVERMRRAFDARGKRIHAALEAMDGVRCPEPTGAFYVFPDVSACLGKTSAGGAKIGSVVDFASALLEEHLVACVPGADFGGCGEKCVRFSFACSEEQIDAGMERLGEFLGGLR